MDPETYYLETFGCQMNVLDSELLAGELRRLGLRPVRDHRQAGIILFNTCSVRQHAEDKVLSRLGRLKRYKRQRPETIVGVIGCMAERMGTELFARVPHVDLLCGPGELRRLPELIEQVRRQQQRVAALAGRGRRRPAADDAETLDLSREPGSADHPLRAYVRVQRGCDRFCSYCVVPYVRGPQHSRPPANVLEEVRRLAAAGCREVTLLGQTVNSYRYEEDGRAVTLARLLERVQGVEGIDRVRFVTSFPADWDEDLFRVMRDCPRVMPYLHIPAQSGSDRIVKAMNRGYSVAEYLKIIDAARRYVPEIGLAGDFIVGFPGETEEDFGATVGLVRRVQYQNLFIFKYSPRPGTTADRLRADDVPYEIKVRRNNELLAIQSEISLKYKQTLVGWTFEVLVEGYSKAARRTQRAENAERAAERSGAEVSSRRGGQLVGRTPSDLIAVFDGGPEHVGALASVRVESVSPLTLFGRIVSVVLPARHAPGSHES